MYVIDIKIMRQERNSYVGMRVLVQEVIETASINIIMITVKCSSIVLCLQHLSPLG